MQGKDVNNKHKPFRFIKPGLKQKINLVFFIVIFSTAFTIVFFSYFIIRYLIKQNAIHILETNAENISMILDNKIINIEEVLKKYASEGELKNILERFKNAEIETYKYFVENKDISEIKKITNKYFEDNYSNFKSLIKKSLEDDTLSLILKYLYLVKNSYEKDKKHLLLKDEETTPYGYVHELYHVYFGNIIKITNANDVYLIDGIKGRIIYSFSKKPDFGSLINRSLLLETELASIFFKFKNKDVNEILISDISPYLPDELNSSLFFGIKVNNDNDLLVLRFTSEKLTDFININLKDKNNQKVNYWYTKAFLIGEDLYYKTDNPEVNNKQIVYGTEDTLKKLSNNIMIDEKVMAKFLSAPAGYIEFINYTGNKQLGYYKKISLHNEKSYYILTVLNKKDIFRPAIIILFVEIIGGLVVLLLILFLSKRFGNLISERMNFLKNNLNKLINGEKAEKIYIKTDDELEETAELLNKLTDRVWEAAKFADYLAENNFNIEFNAKSENDFFAKALNNLKNRLKEAKEIEEQRKKEDEIRLWINSGIAKFNELLRHHNDDMDLFCYNILKNLIEYVGVVQGAIYLIEEEEGEKIVRLAAAYAYDRRKYIERKLHMGEGLVGTCALEGKTIYLREIPEDYMLISSGLGETLPRSLLIVPMIFNEEITGVIELASINDFEKHKQEFVEKIAESIAITINTVHLNMKTKQLLQESNERAEQLAAQEEELRQNLEELKATQEEMLRIKTLEAERERIRREQEEKLMEQLRKSNEELMKKQEELEWEQIMFHALMDCLNARVTYKDTEGRYLRINKAKFKALNLKSYDEVIGKTDYDVFGGEHFKHALEEEKKIIQEGTEIVDKEELIIFKDGRKTWGSTSRFPLKNKNGEIVGSLVITRDITERKNLKFEVEIYNTLLQNLMQEYPAFYYRIDNNGIIEKCFGSGLNLLNINENQMVGKSIYEFFPEIPDLSEYEFKDDGLVIIQKLAIEGKLLEFRHIILKNNMTYGGYTGIACEVKFSKNIQ